MDQTTKKRKSYEFEILCQKKELTKNILNIILWRMKYEIKKNKDPIENDKLHIM